MVSPDYNVSLRVDAVRSHGNEQLTDQSLTLFTAFLNFDEFSDFIL